MVDYYSLVLSCISFVQERVQGRHRPNLQLNTHQCVFMANKLMEVSHSLRNRDPEILKLVQLDIKVREVLLHLHGSVKRAQILVERCCPEPSSWLAAVMTLRDIKEEVAAILLDLHQCTGINLDIAIASVKGGSCGNEIVSLFKTRENDYQKLLESLQSNKHELESASFQDQEKVLESLQSSGHELQRAAFQDWKDLLERTTNFLKMTEDQHDIDYLRAIYLRSQLTRPKGDLKNEEKLKLDRPSTDLLGNGSFSQVYKHNWLGQEVALKELGGVDETEATLLGQVQHPNVVQFFHYWEVHEGRCGQSFIVMELMPTDLREYIEKSSWKSSNMPFLLPVAIDLMLQIAEAMRHLHSRNLVHRDLKSLNILVKPVDESMKELKNEGYLEVKLADFGSARLFENSSTSTPLSRKIGTKFYGAPEIFYNGEISRDRHFPPKADIWSFGMTCFEILSGRPPFEAEEGSSLHNRILEGLRPTLPEACPQYLKFCIKSCWDLQPERRPSFTDLFRLLRHAKTLSLGMLHLDSTISPMFAYQTREGVISLMDLNSASSHQKSMGLGGLSKSVNEEDKVSPDEHHKLQRRWSSKRKRSDDLQVASSDLHEADRAFLKP